MSGSINFLISMSVILPLLIGLVRFKKVQKNYRPFLIYIILSFISEIISYVSGKVFRTNLVWLNVFDLIECLVLVIQFNEWGFLKDKKNAAYFFLIILFIGWVTGNLIFSEIFYRNRIVTISYSFLLVLLSIREINQAMVLSNKSLYENARFIICIGMILYFTYGIIHQTFKFFGEGFSGKFGEYLFSIEAYPNAIANIVYAFGAYFIPVKANRSSMYD